MRRTSLIRCEVTQETTLRGETKTFTSHQGDVNVTNNLNVVCLLLFSNKRIGLDMPKVDGFLTFFLYVNVCLQICHSIPLQASAVFISYKLICTMFSIMSPLSSKRTQLQYRMKIIFFKKMVDCGQKFLC